MLATLIVSIVLALGTSIFGLVQKELILTSIGRDSQYAFYAADTGAECALYWSERHKIFPTTTPFTVDVSCDGQTKTTSVSAIGNSITSSFRFESSGYCVDVSVEKTLEVDDTVSTIIHADGYSRNCDSIVGSTRVLQRSVELRN